MQTALTIILNAAKAKPIKASDLPMISYSYKYVMLQRMTEAGMLDRYRKVTDLAVKYHITQKGLVVLECLEKMKQKGGIKE